MTLLDSLLCLLVAKIVVSVEISKCFAIYFMFFLLLSLFLLSGCRGDRRGGRFVALMITRTVPVIYQTAPLVDLYYSGAGLAPPHLY